MKIYTSKWRNHYISPYTILEKFFFWRKNYDPYKQNPPKWLQNICDWNLKFIDTIHPRISYVKIDKWDTWSMPESLGLIILPMLKQLKEDKQGSPFIDDEDVPDELKSTNAPTVNDDGDIDDLFHKRWEWVLDEEIIAFESLFNNWEEWFDTGEFDYEFIKTKDGLNQMVHGPNHTLVTDWEGRKDYQHRIDNGFRLFGKYFLGHWS